jgi:replicative DNA helicase
MLDFEKSLYDIHAEEMCIGSILVDHTVLYESVLSVSDFYGSETKMCFKVILELFEARKHIDAVTIHNKLSDEVNIDTIYMYSANVHSSVHFKDYHDIVIKL